MPHPRAGREPAPDPRPAPSPYLLAGIDAGLSGLSGLGAAGSVRFDAWQLADDLKTALARTAACGDTCRVRPAADAVRSAANLLYAGTIDEAYQVLLRARALLTEPRGSAPLPADAERAGLDVARRPVHPAPGGDDHLAVQLGHDVRLALAEAEHPRG